MLERFVVFELENQDYAIDINIVSEITELKEITKLPNSADYVEGVLNLRGVIVPIINLKKRMNMTNTCESNHILVINVQGSHYGLIIDDAKDVKSCNIDQMESVPPLLKNNAVYVTKVISDSDMVIVLDALKLISGNDIVISKSA